MRDKREATAIDHAVRKLEALGPALGYPHQSAIRGSRLALRELRPRAGRSRWRALYVRVDATSFAILAIAPEAQLDQVGFARSVRRAEERATNPDPAS